MDCNLIPVQGYDACLIITHQTSGNIEYAGLHTVRGYQSILEGRLLDSSLQANMNSKVSYTTNADGLARVSFTSLLRVSVHL